MLYYTQNAASEVVIQTLILTEDTQNVSTAAASVVDCSWDTAAACVARSETAALARALLYGSSLRGLHSHWCVD